MKQQILLILLIHIGISFFNYADEIEQFENQPLDSLLNAYTELNDDSIKVIILNEIAWHYIILNADSGISFGLRALELAAEIEWEKGKAESYSNIGEAYRFKGNISASIEYHKQALEIYYNIDDVSGQAGSLGELGISYFNLSDLTRSHDHFIKALNLYRELDDQIGIAKNLSYLGILNSSFNEYELALKYFNESKIIFEKLNKKENTAIQIGNIGLTHYELKNYDSALENFEKALKIFEELNSLWNISAFLGNVGLVYSDIEEYEKSESLFRRALEIARQINDEYGIAHQNGNLGKLFLKRAKNFSNQSLILKNELLRKAINYLKYAEEKFRQLREKDQRKEFLFSLSEAYKLQNDFKNALKNYSLAVEIRDSIFSIENKKMIAELEARLELDVKEKEIEILNKEKENQLLITVSLISFIILIALAAIIILILYFKLKRDNLSLTENIIKRKEVEESLRLNEIELKKYHEHLEQLVKERTEKLEKEINEKLVIKHVLNKSEERYNLAVEAAELGTWDWDLTTNEVIYSGKYSEMLGFEQGEIYPHLISWEESIHPDDKENIFNKLKEHIEGKTDLYKTEYRLKTKAGYWKWVLDVGKVVESDLNGKPKRAVGIHHDIDDRKNAELELESAKLKAEKANQLKSEFLAQISHEIRSPLNAVLNFSQLLKDEFTGKMNEEVEISFSGIESSSKRVIRTIDLILNMSELQLGTYEIVNRKIDLVVILFNLRKEYLNLAKRKNLTLNFISECNIAEINSDEYAVNQIFANLIDNAIKYTHEGFVEINLSQIDQEKYSVKVRDSGIGISKEFHKEIFEAFSQEERGYTRRFDGSGLGLSLVKKYCELINAEIKIESERGKGTTFSIVL